MPLGLLKVTKWAAGAGRDQKNEKKEVNLADSASSQSLLPLTVTTPLSPIEGGFIDQSSMSDFFLHCKAHISSLLK
jgi:hypothetical protein